MIEKFSDFEGTKYLDQEGTFVFEVMNYELKESKSGSTMAVFEVKADEGTTTLYHSLNPKARWSYNGLIKACLKLTPEQAKTFELDYETVGNQLVGKKFKGVVEADTYVKQIKIPLEDGTFEDGEEEKVTYKIKEYASI